MPCPCRVAKGLDCVVPIWFTLCDCLILTCHSVPMPRPCRAPTMPLWKRLLKTTAQHGIGTAWARHGMCELTSAVSRRTLGNMPRFGFFRLPRGHSRRLLTRMLLPFGMCLICSDDDGDSKLYEIIQFYELILKLKPAFLLLLCYVFWLSVGNNSFKFLNVEILILKYLKNFCLSSFRRRNRVWNSFSPPLARNTLWIQYFRFSRFSSSERR